MPTFTSPVSVAEFQVYIKDASTDPTTIDFFGGLLDVATERVYTWLDRDFTPLAERTDVFWGDGSSYHWLRYPAGSITEWTSVDMTGAETVNDSSALVLFDAGRLVRSTLTPFAAGLEHRIAYELPATLTCPETVRQVITEIATEIFDESRQGDGMLGIMVSSSRDAARYARSKFGDLSERHKEQLRPYKRYPC